MKRPALRLLIALGLSAGLAAQARSETAPSIEARLAKVQPFLAKALRARLGSASPVTVHWIGESDRFWMKRREAGGWRYVVVDAAGGGERPAFDHQAMAAARGAAMGAALTPDSLPVTDVDLAHGDAIDVTTPAGAFACRMAARRCEPAPRSAPSDLILAPDGSQGVFKRGHDLWLRTVATGEERRLTRDGEADFAYGDYDSYGDVEKVQRRRQRLSEPLVGVVWSPDSRFVLGLRQDLRQTPERLLTTEYLPPEGGDPVTYRRRAPLSGDAKRPDSILTLVDTRSGAARRVALDPQALNDWALPYYAYAQKVWWDERKAAAFLIGADRGGRRFQLLRIDLASGEVRPVITETNRFSVRLNTYDYALPNVQVLSSGREAVWYSERDGYGHLYLYDLTTGKVRRQLTQGAWNVADLVRVDERARTAYFTAVGRAAADIPVYRRLYKVSLDGGEPVLLTPESGDHEFNGGYEFWEGAAQPGSSLSPSGRYIVDSYVTAKASPGLVVRDSAGRLIKELIKPDPGVFARVGVAAPEIIKVKAADGATDLYGVLYRPTDFDPSKRYPVVEMTYPGPQGRSAPLTVSQFFGSSDIGEPFAVSELGFIVLVLDGRGSAYRSKAFREAFFGGEDPFGAADHVAALPQIAAQKPYFDAARVGVTGHSYGGYGSLRSMLLFPDAYKAGVAGVGPADWTEFPDPVSTERYFGDPSSSPQARAYYTTTSNARLAGRLKGDLLLIYGGVDEVVPLKEAMKLSNAFIAADKPFNLTIVPDSGHTAGRETYGVRETMRFFMEKLGGPVAR